MITTLTFPERYWELKYDMELPDWQIAKRMGMSVSTLAQKLYRYEFPVAAELAEMAEEERARRRELQAAS